MSPSAPPFFLSPIARHSDLERLYRDRALRTFASGQVIPLAERSLWVVHRGVVALNGITAEAQEVLLGLAVPATPFGLPLAATDAYQAVALSDADLRQVSMAEVEHHPLLAEELSRQLGRRLQQSQELVALLTLKRTEDRLRRFLHLLGRELGQPIARGSRLSVRFTHQQLANAVRTTRVTVTRLLSQFQAEGWLQVDADRHIVLLG